MHLAKAICVTFDGTGRRSDDSQLFQSLDPNDMSRWNMLRQVLAETASAIRFLHDCDVIHRDVKPTNLMITPRAPRDAARPWPRYARRQNASGATSG